MTKTQAHTAPGETMHYQILDHRAQWSALCDGTTLETHEGTRTRAEVECSDCAAKMGDPPNIHWYLDRILGIAERRWDADHADDDLKIIGCLAAIRGFVHDAEWCEIQKRQDDRRRMGIA